jgi:hypothetical protein
LLGDTAKTCVKAVLVYVVPATPSGGSAVPSLNTTLNGASPVSVSVSETVPPLQIEPPPLIAAVGLLFTVVIVTVPILPPMAEASQLSTSTMSLMEYMVGLVGVTVMV